jgi:hypothetical protein
MKYIYKSIMFLFIILFFGCVKTNEYQFEKNEVIFLKIEAIGDDDNMIVSDIIVIR